jgi:hypothetical protein
MVLRWGLWPARWLVNTDISFEMSPLLNQLIRMDVMNSENMGALEQWILGTVPGLAAFFILFLFGWRKLNSDVLASRFFAIAIIISPIPAVFLGATRWAPDWIHIFALGMFVLLTSAVWASVFALVALLAHPEQATVAMFILLLVGYVEPKLVPRGRVLMALFVGLALLLSMRFIDQSPDDSSRVSAFTDLWKSSSLSFFSDSPGSLYALLGGGWVMIVAWFWIKRGDRYSYLLPIGLILAISLTIFTYDGTRVFVGVYVGAIIIGILSLSYWIEGLSRFNVNVARAWFGLFIIVTLFMPPVIWRYSELIFTGFPYGELISSINS